MKMERKFGGRRHWIVAGLLVGAAALASAQPAPPPAGMPGQGGPGMHRMDGHGSPEMMKEWREFRLQKFKQKLAITPAQEGAWTAWTAAMQQPAGAHMSREQRHQMRAEMDKLSTPERIDRMRALRAQRMAEMDKRLDATKAFYNALTPEQRKTFDAQRHGRMMGRGGMGMRGEGRGMGGHGMGGMYR